MVGHSKWKTFRRFSAFEWNFSNAARTYLAFALCRINRKQKNTLKQKNVCKNTVEWNENCKLTAKIVRKNVDEREVVGNLYSFRFGEIIKKDFFCYLQQYKWHTSTKNLSAYSISTTFPEIVCVRWMVFSC